MNVTQARKKAAAYINKITQDHAREYDRIVLEDKKEAEALWKTRGAVLIKQIEGYINEASAKGDRHTYAPTSVNPSGDQIIYLCPADRPIYKLLMNHFIEEGFEVEEYQYYGMKITW